MRTKTDETTVTGEISVWAIPRSAHYMECNPNEDPFEYRLYSDENSPWQRGATKVYTEEKTITLPAGIDLVQKAVQTLQEAKDEATREYTEKMTSINQQIKGLLLLTGPSDNDAIEGEAETITWEGNR